MYYKSLYTKEILTLTLTGNPSSEVSPSPNVRQPGKVEEARERNDQRTGLIILYTQTKTGTTTVKFQNKKVLTVRNLYYYTNKKQYQVYVYYKTHIIERTHIQSLRQLNLTDKYIKRLFLRPLGGKTSFNNSYILNPTLNNSGSLPCANAHNQQDFFILDLSYIS